MRRSTQALSVTQLEGGTFTETAGFPKSSEKKESCKPVELVAIALLLLLALTGLALFCLSTSALACRLLDLQLSLSRRQQPADGGTFFSGPGANVTSACSTDFQPLSYLWSVSGQAMMIVNSIAALVMLQSLMLVPRIGPAKVVSGVRAARFEMTEREPCPLHLTDVIMKFAYKTRCRDDVIMRTQLPSAPVPLPASMKRTMTHGIIEAQMKKHQLHEVAFGRGVDPLERLPFSSLAEPGAAGGPPPLQQVEMQPPEDFLSGWSGTDWVTRVNEKEGEQK